MMPMLPRHAVRAKRSHSVLFGAFWPVRAVMNLSLVVSSNGFRRLPISGVVLTRKVHLLVKPCMKVAYKWHEAG